MSSVKGMEFFDRLNDYQLPKTLHQEIRTNFLTRQWFQKEYPNTNNITATTKSFQSRNELVS